MLPVRKKSHQIFCHLLMISASNVFHSLQARMDHTAFTMRTASENLANRLTPGYKAKEPVPLSKASGQTAAVLRRTNPGHLGARSFSSELQTREDTSETDDSTLTGNTVCFRKELARVNDANQHNKQMHLIYTSYISTLHSVLQRR